MKLSILLPYMIFAKLEEVSRIVAETRAGSFGLLPHRLDCVAALAPGILSYAAGKGDKYVAIDEGVLVKSGDDVVISVRRAVAGTDLRELHQAVNREYLRLDAEELEMRGALSKMESAVFGRFTEYQHERR